MQVMGEYRFINSLGLGATSEVFLAERMGSGGRFAVKVFNPSSVRDPQMVQRLRLENEALIRLTHPNVIRVVELLETGTQFAIVLEYMDGGDLRSWNESYDLPFVEPKLWILAQVCRGLGAAHEQGILHRDLKLENVLLNRDGSVKLTDFGVAKFIDRTTHTQHGLLIGSLGYLAPEVIDGRGATASSDLFALGVLAYELLTGRAPFQGQTASEILKSTSLGQHTPLGAALPYLDAPVATVLGRCLASQPADRPASVWEVEAGIMNYLQAQGALPLMRQLVRAEGSPLAVTELYQLKRDQLRSRVQRAANQNEFLPAVREMQRLFPDDSSWEQSPLLVPPKQRRRWLYALPLLLPLLFVGVWLQRGREVQEAAVVVPTVVTTGLISAPPVSAVGLVEPPKVQYGRIRFQVPGSVKIYLDGQLVDHTRQPVQRLKVGTYDLKMVQEGYLPIENSVKVKAEKEIVVRAGNQ